MKKLLLFALVIVSLTGCGMRDRSTVTATVLDKDRVCNSGNNGNCSYLIFTDKTTYQVTDSFLDGRFNSSDVYGRIKVGATYEFDLVGTRNEFLSWYPNILEYREVER